MESTAREQEDLQFIKEAVSRRRRGEGAPEIYLLWGILTLIGYPILDWRPEYEGLYWLVMSPLGGALTWYLGKRRALQIGDDSRRDGVRWTFHWLCVFAAGALLSLMVLHGRISVESTGPIILLLVAVGMALGAVHFRPRLGWNALILAAGYVELLYVQKYAWTMIGVAFFIGSVVNYILARRASDHE